MISGSGGPKPLWETPWSPWRGREGIRLGPDLWWWLPAGAPLPPSPAPQGAGTRLRPFANRLDRKLSTFLVSSAAGSVVCGRATRGGGCGAATGGRPSMWVWVHPQLPGPAAAARASWRGGGRGPHAARVRFPANSKLHHSGNDDSGRIIQDPASLFPLCSLPFW